MSKHLSFVTLVLCLSFVACAYGASKTNKATLSSIIKEVDGLSGSSAPRQGLAPGVCLKLDAYQKASERVLTDIEPTLKALSIKNAVLFTDSAHLEGLLLSWDAIPPWFRENIPSFRLVLDRMRQEKGLRFVVCSFQCARLLFLVDDSGNGHVRLERVSGAAVVHEGQPDLVHCGGLIVSTKTLDETRGDSVDPDIAYLSFSPTASVVEHGLISLMWSTTRKNYAKDRFWTMPIAAPVARFDLTKGEITKTKDFVPVGVLNLPEADFAKVESGQDLQKVFGVPEGGRTVNPDKK